ncbi:MAG: hypothetical protein EPN41_07325 [Candidimonas sp.]|nr:MAG: hypothetical protein EPN41_07325 [Candidimonas sp.]
MGRLSYLLGVNHLENLSQPLQFATLPQSRVPATPADTVVSGARFYRNQTNTPTAALSAGDPAIEAVTVSTDDIDDQRDAILKRLQSAQAAGVSARAYADASPQRLNYLIDPSWGGETPRTLVIRADGSRRAVSGTLTTAQLKALVKADAP